MGRSVDLGVFLPVTNNGWIISKTSPQFLPSFAHNRDIAQLAERIGFSYVFSMAKWRGFGGDVEFWKYSIESMILMTGLAAAAPTLRLIASIAPALMHPAVFAKMAATMDDVAGGRMGFNIVSAGNKGEYTQMGLWPENFEDYRYDYCEEWVTAVKRLWTEDNVTLDGRFFKLDECQSWPKPVQSKVPVVCATTSERGWQFVAQHCDAALFGGGKDVVHEKGISRRIKEVAAAHGRNDVQTHTLVNLIQGDTDADAQKILEHYQAGADHVAIENIYKLRARGQNERRAEHFRNRFESNLNRLFYAGIPFVGGPQRVADMIEELAVDGDLDGFLFIFPDFIEGLTRFNDQVMPLLRSRGLRRLTAPFAPGRATVPSPAQVHAVM
jgi:pyrimidine oxygenase